MQKLFNSRWPILLAGMNGGSDKKLALAVHEAGGFPSLFVTPVYNCNKRAPNSPLPRMELDFDPMYYELLDFIRSKGDSQFGVAISPKYLFYPQFLKMARDLKISHWEIFPRWEGEQICASDLLQDDMIYQGIKYLRSFSHVMGRLLKPALTDRMKILSGVNIKGTDSGGGQGTLSVKDFFSQQIKLTANTVPYGGIGTPQQVREYIRDGAPVVGVGTLFAACVESPLSMQVKQKMVEASAPTQITAFDKSIKIQQNALVLDPTSLAQSDDDANHTGALYNGIIGDGSQGIIMAGQGIRYVDRIRTVKETMEYLTSELK